MGELLLLRANAHRWRGEVEPAEADARQAMDLLDRGGAPWCTAAGLAAWAAGRLVRSEVVTAIAGTLRDTQPRQGASAAYAVALAETAVQVLYFAKEPTAPDALLGMVADLETRGFLAADAAAVAVVRRARAYRAYFRGDFGATAEL